MATIPIVSQEERGSTVSGEVGAPEFVPGVYAPEPTPRPRRVVGPLRPIESATGGAIAEILPHAVDLGLDVMKYRQKLLDDRKRLKNEKTYIDAVKKFSLDSMDFFNKAKERRGTDVIGFSDEVRSTAAGIQSSIAESIADPDTRNRFLFNTNADYVGMVSDADRYETHITASSARVNLNEMARGIVDATADASSTDQDILFKYDQFRASLDNMTGTVFTPEESSEILSNTEAAMKETLVMSVAEKDPKFMMERLSDPSFQIFGGTNLKGLTLTELEKMDLRNRVGRIRDSSNDVTLSMLKENLSAEKASLEQTGQGNPEYAQALESIREEDPAAYRDIQLERAFSVATFEVSNSTKYMSRPDGEAFIANIKAGGKLQEGQEGLAPIAGLLDMTKPSLDFDKRKAAMESVEANYESWWNLYDKDGAAWVDATMTMDESVFGMVQGNMKRPTDMSYTELPLKEKVLYRKAFQDSVSNANDEIRDKASYYYLTKAERVDFTNRMKAFESPLEKMKLAKQFQADIGNEAFLIETGRMMENGEVGFADMALLSLMEVPDVQPILSAMEHMNTVKNPDSIASKDDKEYEGISGLVSGHMQVMVPSMPEGQLAFAGHWNDLIKKYAKTLYVTGKYDSTESAQVAFDTFIGNYQQVARLGRGQQTVIVPKWIRTGDGWRGTDVGTWERAAVAKLNQLDEFKPITEEVDAQGRKVKVMSSTEYVEGLKDYGNFVLLDHDHKDLIRGQWLILVGRDEMPVVNDNGDYFVLPMDSKILPLAESMPEHISYSVMPH